MNSEVDGSQTYFSDKLLEEVEKVYLKVDYQLFGL